MRPPNLPIIVDAGWLTGWHSLATFIGLDHPYPYPRYPPSIRPPRSLDAISHLWHPSHSSSFLNTLQLTCPPSHFHLRLTLAPLAPSARLGRKATSTHRLHFHYIQPQPTLLLTAPLFSFAHSSLASSPSTSGLLFTAHQLCAPTSKHAPTDPPPLTPQPLPHLRQRHGRALEHDHGRPLRLR